jgi:hypothetical protein
MTARLATDVGANHRETGSNQCDGAHIRVLRNDLPEQLGPATADDNCVASSPVAFHRPRDKREI